MLFNSFEFIFLFLPVAFTLYALALHWRATGAALAILTAASLFFWAYWNPAYLPLIIFSLLINYGLGLGILAARDGDSRQLAKVLVILGVVINLAIIGYYKYWHFFVVTAGQIAGTGWSAEKLVIPVGISFFTFTQIAFLVDVYAGRTQEKRPLRYSVFLLFFPHLLAGPIIHHREIMPQFDRLRSSLAVDRVLAIGLTIFTIGLAKKVLIADTLAPFNDVVFAQAAQGRAVDFLSAWGATFGYSFQLYFDFSGYSDMAVGLGYMFGVRLPVNFYSPYRARNFVEFWRGWHITLSRFLRDYVYLPLGGNRQGRFRRHVNILATMALGGLWHGAGWTFILWGCLQGLGIVVAHIWHEVRRRVGLGEPRIDGAGRWFAMAVTFLLVTLLWVLFRAKSVAAAVEVYRGLIGLSGIVLPQRLAELAALSPEMLVHLGIKVNEDFALSGLALQFGLCAILFGVVWLLPNTSEIMSRYEPVLLPDDAERLPPPASFRPKAPRRRWIPAPALAVCMGVMFAAVLVRISGGGSTFLYYDF